MRKRYLVELTRHERSNLLSLLNKGVAPARILTRARILLAADEHKTDAEIAVTLHVHPATVERTRRRFAEGRAARALHENPRPGGRPKLDGKQEAFLVALACSHAPSGRAHWTLQRLADRLVELGVVEAISDETVRRVLKNVWPAPSARGLLSWHLRGLRKRIRHGGLRPLPRWRSARPGSHKTAGIGCHF